MNVMTANALGLLAALIVLPDAATSKPDTARPDRAWDAALASFDNDEHPDLKGVVIMHDGRIVAERYFNGDTAETLHDIRSAGKSITSLLMGIAIDRGQIAGLDDPVARYWPEARAARLEMYPCAMC